MPPMPLDGPFKTHSTGAQAWPTTSIFIIILSRLICVLIAAADPRTQRVSGCYVLNKHTGEVDTFLAHAL